MHFLRIPKGKWIYLTNNRDKWPALVNAVMNLSGPLLVGNFLTK
jgi:hypothetical protein